MKGFVYARVLQLELEEEQDEDDLLLTVATLMKRKRRRHRWWVHPIIQKRRQHGAYHHLVTELLLDEDRFHRYFRLTREQFAQVLYLVEPLIAKQSRTRESISPRERLAMCLRLVLLRVWSTWYILNQSNQTDVTVNCKVAFISNIQNWTYLSTFSLHFVCTLVQGHYIMPLVVVQSVHCVSENICVSILGRVGEHFSGTAFGGSGVPLLNTVAGGRWWDLSWAWWDKRWNPQHHCRCQQGGHLQLEITVCPASKRWTSNWMMWTFSPEQ